MNILAIKTSSAKAKGRKLQQWVCKRISERFGFPYDQQDDQCMIHSREMGQQGTDVVLRGEALMRFPFAIECKNQESMSLVDSVNQARDNLKPPYKYWMLVHKRKRFKKPIVIMDFDDFLELYRR